MNIVSNSVVRIWPATPAFQPPQAAAQATADSNLSPPADSRAQPPAAQPVSNVENSDSTSEVQAYLLRLQEIDSSSVTDAADNGSLSDAQGILDGNDAVDAESNAALLLDGPSAKAMSVSVSGTTAVVWFADGSDPLTLNLGSGSVTLNFADGTIAQIMAQTPARSLEAAVEAESRGVAKMV